METLTSFARGRKVRIFFERDGMRGGPFTGLSDPGEVLVMPRARSESRQIEAKKPSDGQVTLRNGVIKDADLRHNLRTATFCGTPEYLDILLVEDDEVVARWHFTEARIVEVADRSRRPAAEESYEFIVFSGRLSDVGPGREGEASKA